MDPHEPMRRPADELPEEGQAVKFVVPGAVNQTFNGEYSAGRFVRQPPPSDASPASYAPAQIARWRPLELYEQIRADRIVAVSELDTLGLPAAVSLSWQKDDRDDIRTLRQETVHTIERLDEVIADAEREGIQLLAVVEARRGMARRRAPF